MPADMASLDPEALIREAVAGIAVPAFSRGINVVAHVDNRLPSRLQPLDPELPAFLRRGLARTIELGGVGRVVAALWLAGIEADGSVAAELEIARARQPGETLVARLADLWSLPLEGATARPRVLRDDDEIESILIPVRMSCKPGTPPVAEQWGSALAGKRILDAREVLIDPDRLAASVGATGALLDLAFPPSQALAVMRTRLAESPPVDVVMLEPAGADTGPAVEAARAIRAEPEFAQVRLVMNALSRGQRLSLEERALFNAVSASASPRRRGIEIIQELFRAPAAPEPGARGGGPTSPAGDAIPALRGRRILIAEDVATNRMLLEALLMPTGAAVESVHEGASALRRHREEPADLILMDLQMPGTGGIAAVTAIRELEGPVGRVPVVALTAYAREADRRMALEAGMDAYLPKPIVVAEFYALLQRLLPEAGGEAAPES